MQVFSGQSDSSIQPGLTGSGRATFCLRMASYFSLSLRSASDSFIGSSQELSGTVMRSSSL